MRVRALAFLVAALTSTVASAGVEVWTTSGPAGGASAVISDPGSPGILYAGGVTSAIFKSTDGGSAWQTLGLQQVTPLAADPSGSIYASAITFSGGPAFEGTLYVSHDGGAEWNVLSQRSETGFRLTIDPFAATTLYRIDTTTTPNHPPALFGMLFRSTDFGLTWSEIDQGLGLNFAYITAFAPAPRTRGTFFAATAGSVLFQQGPSAIYKTTDNGSSWTLESTILGTVVTLAIDPFASSTLYAGVVAALDSGGTNGLYKSDDDGSTFQSVNNLSPTQVVMDPSNPNRLYLATYGQGVQTSADGGSTWVAMNTGLTDLTVIGLTLDSGGTALHAATASGVFDYQISHTACPADTHALCLNSGRFSVTADFQRTPEGPSAPAAAIRLTNDTGYFWFFDPTNIEVVVKILTGCAFNNEYWVFAGGLTNVGVELKVTDTQTGALKAYSSAVGTPFQPIQDTSAFPCP